MRWTVTPQYKGAAVSDPDAQTYLSAVEAADGQPLEPAVAQAVNDFVIGCKADGIWSAIKASCILAGARTLAGALVPLKGAEPTNVNFVSGDYNRKTGLVGNGSTKFLNSNRNNDADPQNNCHLAIWKSDAVSGTNPYFIGCGTSGFAVNKTIGQNGMHSNSGLAFGGTSSAQGFHGHSRISSSIFSFKRPGASTNTASNISTTPPGFSHFVFSLSNGGLAALYTASRLAFYSIGESLDLALLDARVTALVNAFDAANLDPYYSDISLLLHGNGINGSTLIIDNSPTPKTVTAVGNAQISTAQSKFGVSSILFDGNADELTTPSNNNFAFGTSDFTVEAWVFELARAQYAAVLEIGNHAINGILFMANGGSDTNGRIGIYCQNGGGFGASTVAGSLNAWNHLAWVRSAGQLKCYVNGIGGTSAAFTFNHTDTATITIGSTATVNLAYDFNGYIDDLRITKGVARYTANFTPPTAQFPDA
jgi:hypothetical protein